jgi:D-alanyl-D-alanine carboxypeptidase
MKRVRRIFSLLLFSACSVALNAQIDSALAVTLQNEINNLQATYQVKGVSAAAYIPGQGIWYGSAGVSHGTTPVDSAMLFSIGSITKTFVAAEILKLVEAGYFSLDDSLYGITGPRANIDSTITIRQLLMHRSGIGDFTNITWQNAMFADPYQTWYFPVAMDSFTTAPIFSPGAQYSYCNANYSMLGVILEEQLNDSLHHLLRDSLLTPLNLGNTYMETFEAYPNAYAHNWSAPNFNPALAADCVSTPHEALWTSAEAAGGYFSTPIDLVMWGHALYSGQVLSPASLAQMTTFSPASSSYYNGYGLGCQRFPYLSRIYWGHGGNYYGYAASMMYYPQDSICIALLINQDVNAAYPARIFMNTLLNAMATGTAEAESPVAFSTYPNPANERVTVECPSAATTPTTLTLSDLSGRIVHTETITGAVAQISTAEFPAGVYMMTMEAGSSTSTRKLIITH